MVVAWDVNDQGQIAGGNMFVEADGTSVSMGNIFARSMNNSGQVVGNSGQTRGILGYIAGLVELGTQMKAIIARQTTLMIMAILPVK